MYIKFKITYIFLLKKINISKFLGNNLLRLAFNICLEKILSAGTEVAGTIKYFKAMSLSGANTCAHSKIRLHWTSNLDEAFLSIASLRM